MVRDKAWKLTTVAVAISLAIGALIFVLVRAYTPTTTAYVLNDTANTVTVDYCSDSTVIVPPGTRQQITPFTDSRHAYCNVFRGEGDLSKQAGCIYIPAPNGRVATGTVVRISTMRPSIGHAGCQ